MREIFKFFFRQISLQQCPRQETVGFESTEKSATLSYLTNRQIDLHKNDTKSIILSIADVKVCS